ncbi:hypothetical protein [Legionella sp. WA2024007413]
MDNKFELNSKPSSRKLFLRTDNSPCILPKTVEKYNATPAMHLNLLPSNITGYVDSGYLSTFEYKKGLGLDSTLEYSTNYKYIHFLFLDSEIAEVIQLTGGTSGLTHDGEQTHLIATEGTVWELPCYQSEIPQIFYTDGVEVELGSLKVRSAFEVLLGGNWADFAEIISIEGILAHTLFKQARGKSEEEFYTLLLQLAHPYVIGKTEVQPEAYQLRYDTASEKAILINWWNRLSSSNKNQLIIFYSNLHNKSQSYPQPNDFKFLKELHQLYTTKNKLEQNHPEMRSYFHLVESAIDKFDALCRIYKMYESPKQSFIRMGLMDILSGNFPQQITPNTIHDLCNTLETYIDYLTLETQFCLLVSEIHSLKLTVEEQEKLFPTLGKFVSIIELNCKKDIDNLHARLDHYRHNMADIKINLPKIRDGLKAYKYQKHYAQASKVCNFCNELQIIELPTGTLAEWLKKFYMTQASTVFQSCDEFEEVITYGKLMDSLLNHAKRLHDSIIKFNKAGELDPPFKKYFLSELQNNIVFSIACFKKINERDPYRAAQDMDYKIQKLSNWTTILARGNYKTIYPESARMFYEPFFNPQKRDRNQNESQYELGGYSKKGRT